jgi:hypothetical protein
VLWLFGDSWIDAAGLGRRDGAVMVSNSLAVQRGYDPTRAEIEFHWGEGPEGRPAAFFPDRERSRLWPGHGARVGDGLLLFLMRVVPREGGLGFEVSGWDAVLVSNPDDDPGRWGIDWLETPSNDLHVIVGSGGVLTHDGYLYAFGAQEPEARHDVYLARWREEDARGGRLDPMEWWGGDGPGWIGPAGGPGGAEPVFTGGQTEFTVHYDEAARAFVELQTDGFGPAVIVRRSAPAPAGPWSEPDTVFTPPQNGFPRIMVYQGKAHPYLAPTGRVVTYCTNSFDFADHGREPWLYYPRFVRLGEWPAR